MRLIITILIFLAGVIGANAQGIRAQYWVMQKGSVNSCADLPVVSDPDAQKFICATRITDMTIANAINQAVISMKDSAVWSTHLALYPLVSDNLQKTRAEQTAYNLKDTAQFKITWNSTAFSATGIDFTTATGHGVTGIFPDIHLPVPTSVALGYYSREQLTGGRDWADIQGSSVQLSASCELSAGTAAAFMYNGSTAVTGANGGSVGMFIFTRTAASGTGVIKIYKNGSQIASGNFTAGSIPTTALTLGYNSISGQRECAFAFVSSGMTADQARAMTNIINAFNTALGRNVY